MKRTFGDTQPAFVPKGEVKLTYYDGRGLAESVRLTLHELAIPFTDVRWPEPEEDARLAELRPRLPYGQVPFYEEGPLFTLAQSNAILRYLARKGGLYGSTPEEAAEVDLVIEGVVDIRQKRDPLHYFDVPEEKKQAEVTKFWTETLAKWAPYFERILVKNGGEWIIGAHFTVADIQVYNVFSIWMADPKWDRSKIHVPHLEKLVQKVGERPRIKQWIAARPKSDW